MEEQPVPESPVPPNSQSDMAGGKRVTLRFNVSYMTNWGENLVLCGSDARFGSWVVEKGIWMDCYHKDPELIWCVLVSVQGVEEFTYQYAVTNDNFDVIKWDSMAHVFKIPEDIADGDVIDIQDSWQDPSQPENLLARSAFRDVVFSGRTKASNPVKIAHAQPGHAIVRFCVSNYRLEPGQEVCVVGTSAALGNWENDSALLLSEVGTPRWEGEVAVPIEEFPLTYKYLVRGGEVAATIETGDDHHVLLEDCGASRPPAMVVCSDGHFRYHSLWRGAGLATPVFSLRSKQSVGCGEFLDLLKLIDISNAAGFRLIQLLPVNDTSVYKMWWDSYPYSSLSVFALHPMYLSLDALLDGDLGIDARDEEALRLEIASARAALDLKEVDYEATMKAKMSIALKVYKLAKGRELRDPKYLEYFEENKEWLRPYAAFCFLRDLTGTSDHTKWGVLGSPTQELLDRITSPAADHHDSIAFSYYMQWSLHRQLSTVSTYAVSKRVALKGDLPIGVDKRSVDTWMNPGLFRMDKSTGAPPDYFDPNGQNWGFPTYNWEEMAKDNYGWWRARLRQMGKYFHAYRIDHILGFFRIWEMPDHATTGCLGRFRPSLPVWQGELEGKGVWDFDRLCIPYIRWHLLEEEFGERAQEVAYKFLMEVGGGGGGGGSGVYRFRPEFDTEAKILAALRPREGSPAWLREEGAVLRKGLFKLIQNVVLLRDPEDARKFYPRIKMEDTSSFAELDPYMKDSLKHIYHSYYFERQNDFWRENALRTLPVLMQATDMLVCGEDLGMVPSCVPPVLSELCLLGLRIQRMPLDTATEFADPSEYDYMTVAAPSCHDTTTTRAWYEEDEGRRARFYRTILGGVMEQPPVSCTTPVVRAVLRQHLDSPSCWAIIPVPDLMAISERYTGRPAAEETINDPTNPKHYWRFRLHTRLEALAEDRQWLADLQGALLASGRCEANDCPELLAAYSSPVLYPTV